MKRFIPALLVFGAWIINDVAPARAEGIGLVTGIRGEATVRHDRTPQAQRLKFKDDLFWQDTLSTGTDAQLRLLILQKSVITMKELTQLQLREDLASPNQPKKKSVVDLVSGTVRVVVDKEALKDGDYEVRTNMAVAAIRGSDVVGQTGADRVEFCTGPGSSVTAIHTNPAVGRRDIFNLECALLFPNRIEVRKLSFDDYRTLTDIGPRGAQNNGHQGVAETKVKSPPPGDGGGGGPHVGPINVYGANGVNCLLCKTKTTEFPAPEPGPDRARRR